MKTACRILLFVFAASIVHAQGAKEIVQHYIDTVSGGSIKNWDKITTMYYDGQSYYSQNDFEQKTNLLTPDKPGYFRTHLDSEARKSKNELFSDSSFEIRTSVFYFLPDKVIILMGNMPPMKRAPIDEDPFVSPHLAVHIWNILEHSKSVELLGVKQLQPGGDSFYELMLTAKGKPYYLFINTQTFFLEYYNITGDGDRSRLAQVGEYKRFGEFLIPMFEAATKNDVMFYWSRKSKLELNPKFDPSIFEYNEK